MNQPPAILFFPSMPAGQLGGALAQVAPAPPPPGGAPAPAPGQQGQPSQGAPAPSPGGGFGGMSSLLLPLLVFAGFYFFLILPQKKKAKELESKLKRGDRVYTNSGLIGKIAELSDKRATLEIAPNVKVQILRSAIGGLDEGDEPKKTDDAKDAKVAELKK